ncbi:hypothetical protein ACFE04_021388 [Oxalis oulophora]
MNKVEINRSIYDGELDHSCLSLSSSVDEKNQNASWKAIDYCGPDPSFNLDQEKKAKLENGQDIEHVFVVKEEDIHGPLYKSLVNMKLPRQVVAKNLQRFGFPTFKMGCLCLFYLKI